MFRCGEHIIRRINCIFLHSTYYQDPHQFQFNEFSRISQHVKYFEQNFLLFFQHCFFTFHPKKSLSPSVTLFFTQFSFVAIDDADDVPSHLCLFPSFICFVLSFFFYACMNTLLVCVAN